MSIKDKLLWVPRPKGRRPTPDVPTDQSLSGVARDAAVTHIYGCQSPKSDVQLQTNLYPYNIAVESEQEGGEGVFVLPNVADFVQQGDDIFVHIQRWRGVESRSFRPIRTGKGNWTRTQYRYRRGPGPVTAQGLTLERRKPDVSVRTFSGSVSKAKAERGPDKGRTPSVQEVWKRESRAEDVQQKHLVQIQFSSHPVVVLVNVAGKILKCSLPVPCVMWCE